MQFASARRLPSCELSPREQTLLLDLMIDKQLVERCKSLTAINQGFLHDPRFDLFAFSSGTRMLQWPRTIASDLEALDQTQCNGSESPYRRSVASCPKSGKLVMKREGNKRAYSTC